MYKEIKTIAIYVSFLTLTPFSAAIFGQGAAARNLHAGAVYVLTNQVENAVTVFSRSAQGTLTPAGEFPSGGAGDPANPLGSQGSLILGTGNQLLFAVNAGSNQISVLRVARNGLVLVDVVDSGGIRPISLTLHENLLYVLNAGGTPNITGFTVGDDGALTPLASSTQPLIGGAAADAPQVGFSSDGSLLVVTEKAGNRLDTYTIDENGLPSAPIDNPSNGMTPFGFAFNNVGTLIVSEAFGGAPNQSATSSYTASESGVLSVISGSVPDFQTANCWIVVTNNGKFAFASNTGSGTISSYGVGPGEGTLTLLNSVAGDTGAGSGPIDMALNNSSRFLYVLADGSHSVASFRVERNGSLTPIDADGGLPPGAVGIAAR
jgi:6-phosphogluconolactonase